MSPDPDSNELEALRRRARQLEASRGGVPGGANRPATSSEPERTKFAMILEELEGRSKESNRWLTGVSIVYVAVVVFLVAILYLRYSDIGKLVGQLDEHLDETDEAIVEQAELHRQQSLAITERIRLAGVDLDGLGAGVDSLEVALEKGVEKADELQKESENLQSKISQIDRLLERIAKRAEPFYVHYAIDPDKPVRFSGGKTVEIAFGEYLPDPLFPPSEDVENEGKYLVPASGTYMVTGWFATADPDDADDPEDPPGELPVVETEIRVDGQTYWSGFSYGTGHFTSGIPIRRGQILTVHAAVRSPEKPDADAEEPPPQPAGSIGRGELRIARIYYSPE